jgi:MOSC domain-containing protein YiiM
MTGRLVGIARRSARRAPMQLVETADVTTGAGIDGDHKGVRFPKRGITILAREDWEAAIALLTDLAGPDFAKAGPLPWTARRANLFVEGVDLPQAAGALVAIGPVRLEVTAQTYPCRRMEEAHPGLMKALGPDWRGGVTCRVLDGGPITLGDPVTVLSSPKPHRPRLP